MTLGGLGLAVALLGLAACGNDVTPADTDGGGTGMDGGGDRPDSSTMGCTAVGPEDTVEACSDGCDNEPDDFADCDDFGCCGLRTDCPATSACGMRDSGTPFDGGTPMTCEGATIPEDTLAACSDGCSNDDDGTFDGGATRIFVDCNDFDCCDPAAPARTDCPATTGCGRRLMADAGPPRGDGGTPMMCEGAPMAEDTLAACSDGCSNDDDGTFDGGGVRIFVDCNDFDCCDLDTPARTDCPATTGCGRRFLDGGPCAAGDENTAAACGDGCSNDGDRFVDCEDFDCCAAAAPARTDCPATSACGRRM